MSVLAATGGRYRGPARPNEGRMPRVRAGGAMRRQDAVAERPAERNRLGRYATTTEGRERSRYQPQDAATAIAAEGAGDGRQNTVTCAVHCMEGVLTDAMHE